MEVYEDYLSRRIVHTSITGILVDSMMSSELFRWLFLKAKKKVRARNKKGKKMANESVKTEQTVPLQWKN